MEIATDEHSYSGKSYLLEEIMESKDGVRTGCGKN